MPVSVRGPQVVQRGSDEIVIALFGLGANGGDTSATPKEYHGIWRDRLDGGTGGSWTVTDEATAELAGRSVATLLASEGVPLLLRFLDRPTLLAHVRGMPHNPIFRSQYLAVLLADAGPSAELDEVLSKILSDVAKGIYSPRQSRLARQLVDWAREQAARRP